KPAVSMNAPAPTTMPCGFTRNTRPFDWSVPRMLDGLAATTRFKTALAEDCWTNFVSSPGAIENDCQFSMVPGVLVTVTVFPDAETVAEPAAIWGPVRLGTAHCASAA